MCYIAAWCCVEMKSGLTSWHAAALHSNLNQRRCNSRFDRRAHPCRTIEIGFLVLDGDDDVAITEIYLMIFGRVCCWIDVLYSFKMGMLV